MLILPLTYPIIRVWLAGFYNPRCQCSHRPRNLFRFRTYDFRVILIAFDWSRHNFEP